MSPFAGTRDATLTNIHSITDCYCSRVVTHPKYIIIIITIIIIIIIIISVVVVVVVHVNIIITIIIYY